MGTFSHVRSSFEQAHFFHTVVSPMPFHPIRFFPTSMLQDCCAVMAAGGEIQMAMASDTREMWPGKDYRSSSTGL
jgi:hypothetical protein